MREALRRRKVAVVAAVVLGLAVLGTSIAVADVIISQVVLADTTAVHLKIVRTSADGFDSGWHTHPGLAVVQVQRGQFMITQGSCVPRIVGAGQTFVEVPDLPVRAVAIGRIKWTTTLIVPDGVDTATPVPNPCG
jgi:quercetin dioxygenase-like cupin family protein